MTKRVKRDVTRQRHTRGHHMSRVRPLSLFGFVLCLTSCISAVLVYLMLAVVSGDAVATSRKKGTANRASGASALTFLLFVHQRKDLVRWSALSGSPSRSCIRCESIEIKMLSIAEVFANSVAEMMCRPCSIERYI